MLLIGPAPWIPTADPLWGPGGLAQAVFFLVLAGDGVSMAFVYLPAIKHLTDLARVGHRARGTATTTAITATDADASTDWVAGLFNTFVNFGGCLGPVVGVHIYSLYGDAGDNLGFRVMTSVSAAACAVTVLVMLVFKGDDRVDHRDF